MSRRSFALARPRVHHDALDWARRVATNGGSVSQRTLRAVSTFCDAIDRAGIRDRFYRLNLFCGNSDLSLNAVRTPLYRGPSLAGTQFGGTTDTNNNFVAGDYSEASGLKGNGSSKYLSTGVSPSNFAAIPSVHLSASGTGLETTGDRIAVGVYDGGLTSLYTLDFAQATTSRRGGRIANGTVIGEASPAATSEVHLLVSRRTSTDLESYRSGASLGTDTALASPAASSRAFTIFCINQAPAVAAFTAGRLRMYSLGSGLTTAEAMAFSDAVNTFNIALGRT